MLYEFLHCRPNDVEMQLVDDSQVLLSTDNQIDEITSQVVELKNQILELETKIHQKKFQDLSDFKEIEEEWKTQMSMKASVKDDAEWKTQKSENW